MSMQRYFNLLGISPTKNLTIIKKAYRKKALKYHPDRNPSAAAKDKFIEVNNAYERILLALERGENPRRRTQQTTTTYRKTTSQQTTTKRKTASEIREERVKEAKKRYEYLKRKEVQDNERYYQKITCGKTWKRFKTIMVTCTFIAVLTTFDLFVFPTQVQVSQIVMKNVQVGYAGSNDYTTSPVKFENGQKAWVAIPFIQMEQKNYFYLERTLFFKDIKYVKIWRNNEWRKYVPDYSLVSTFPVIPAILMLPFITFLSKGRTFTFSFLFNISSYVMPFFLMFVLISNERWAHLLTLGFL
jgi:hypothetical protein